MDRGKTDSVTGWRLKNRRSSSKIWSSCSQKVDEENIGGLSTFVAIDARKFLKVQGIDEEKLEMTAAT